MYMCEFEYRIPDPGKYLKGLSRLYTRNIQKGMTDDINVVGKQLTDNLRHVNGISKDPMFEDLNHDIFPRLQLLQSKTAKGQPVSVGYLAYNPSGKRSYTLDLVGHPKHAGKVIPAASRDIDQQPANHTFEVFPATARLEKVYKRYLKNKNVKVYDYMDE